MEASTEPVVVEHDEGLRRFEALRGGEAVAHLEYVPRTAADGSVSWALTHTWTEPAARGQGLAAVVVAAGLDAARAAGVTVVPVCPYVSDYLLAHPEYEDLAPGAGE